jgi:hypothetical protein
MATLIWFQSQIQHKLVDESLTFTLNPRIAGPLAPKKWVDQLFSQVEGCSSVGDVGLPFFVDRSLK